MDLRIGRISETVWDRSVLKRIKGASGIRDGAFFRTCGAGGEAGCASAEAAEDGADVCVTVSPIVWRIPAEAAAKLSVIRAANELYARQARPAVFYPAVLLPEGTQEEELRRIVDAMEAECEMQGIRIAGFSGEVTGAVTRPVISGTMAGTVPEGALLHPKRKDCSGCGLVMTKYAALEGSVLLARTREEELRRRFPEEMFERIGGFEQDLSVEAEARIAAPEAVCMQALGEGGVLAALDALSRRTGAGLDVDLLSVPIRQESVECAEVFGLDPYAAASAGSLLIAAGEAEALADKLENAGIPAFVIGRMTQEKARILRSGDEVRYLDLPAPDALMGILG